MLIPIFLSVGQCYKPEQKTLVTHVLATLKAFGLKPSILPRSAWDQSFPLAPIQSKMRQSFGVVVIAFPRISVDASREWPDSPQETQLHARSLATVWLQIEATLAFELGKPLLIFVDDRLYPEGLINPKHVGYGAHYFSMSECQQGLPTNMVNWILEFSERVKDLSGPNQYSLSNVNETE